MSETIPGIDGDGFAPGLREAALECARILTSEELGTPAILKVDSEDIKVNAYCSSGGTVLVGPNFIALQFTENLDFEIIPFPDPRMESAS